MTTSIEDKVKIASNFLLSSPPGEVNDVFNGIFLVILFKSSFNPHQPSY